MAYYYIIATATSFVHLPLYSSHQRKADQLTATPLEKQGTAINTIITGHCFVLCTHEVLYCSELKFYSVSN